MDNLKKLGYTDWSGGAELPEMQEGFMPARVIEVNRNSFTVSDGLHEMKAELLGKFLYNTEDPEDFPTVGDWVAIQSFDNHTMAVIHQVLPRRTLLKRKDPGKKIAFQLIAANISYGLVLQSAVDLNLNLMDRYSAMLHESGIRPVPVFSKADLLSPTERDELKTQLSENHEGFMLISSTSESGIMKLRKSLKQEKTYCLLGQSGVGKTTLLNRLLGTEELKVNEIREKDGKGRHTTVRRQLICLDSGSIFVDTPGMRELGNFGIEKGIAETFSDLSIYADRCRFRDCTHTKEEGCAVREAVAQGEIEESRYLSFLKLKKESEHYEMSYRERRKKDKSFGKMLKNYKKMNNRK